MATRSSRIDAMQLKRGLLTALFLVAAIFLSFQGIRMNNPLLMVLVPLLAVLIWLIGNPPVLLVGMLLAQSAKILVPGIPGGFSILNVFQLLIIGWGILYVTTSKHHRRQPVDKAGWLLLLFLANMLLIMSVRGFGVATLGGTTFGGREYVYVLIGLIFYFAAPLIELKEKHIRIIFFGILISSLVPVLVQLSLRVTGGATAFLTNFVGVSGDPMVESLSQPNEQSIVRWSSARGLAEALVMVALVIPAIRRRTVLCWGLLALALAANLSTGFRSRIIGMGLLIFMWLIYDSKDRKQTFLLLVGLGCVALATALAFYPYLPPVAQRTLSFLPFAAERASDPSIILNAQGSTDFRLEIWGYAWKEVPRYLLIGRGITMEVMEWAWLSSWWYATPEFFYANHNYHSGPISLLLDFGLFGFIAGVMFMWIICAEAWRGVRRYCVGKNDLVSRYYAFLTIQLTYSIIAYFLIFGHATQSIPAMVFSAVLLKIFRREMEQKEQVEATVPEIGLSGEALAETEGQ